MNKLAEEEGEVADDIEVLIGGRYIEEEDDTAQTESTSLEQGQSDVDSDCSASSSSTSITYHRC
jgi:hypothetical protein